MKLWLCVTGSPSYIALHRRGAEHVGNVVRLDITDRPLPSLSACGIGTIARHKYWLEVEDDAVAEDRDQRHVRQREHAGEPRQGPVADADEVRHRARRDLAPLARGGRR